MFGKGILLPVRDNGFYRTILVPYGFSIPLSQIDDFWPDHADFVRLKSSCAHVRPGFVLRAFGNRVTAQGSKVFLASRSYNVM
jgi:hypothetical protein